MPYGSLLSQLSWRIFLPTSTPKQIAPKSNNGLAYLVASPHHSFRVVPECCPDVHHLRLSASAKDPTNPTRNDLASETLDLRRTRFSRVYTLLMPAFSLPSAPVALIDRPSPLMERSPTALSHPKVDKTHSFGTTLSPVKFSAQGH